MKYPARTNLTTAEHTRMEAYGWRRFSRKQDGSLYKKDVEDYAVAYNGSRVWNEDLAKVRHNIEIALEWQCRTASDEQQKFWHPGLARNVREILAQDWEQKFKLRTIGNLVGFEGDLTSTKGEPKDFVYKHWLKAVLTTKGMSEEEKLVLICAAVGLNWETLAADTYMAARRSAPDMHVHVHDAMDADAFRDSMRRWKLTLSELGASMSSPRYPFGRR